MTVPSDPLLPPRRERSTDAPAREAPWQRWATLAAVAATIWLLWNTPLLYPLKILVVFFHELSHAAAALATGGSIVAIEVVPREGGACLTIGGNRFLTLSAGYLGSLLVGGVILVLAVRSRRDRELAVLLGGVLLAAALIWVRPVVGFGFLFTTLAGAGLAVAGLYLPATGVDLLLRTLGLTSVLYAVFDIRDDILARPHLLESDAAQLARLTGVPTLVWGLLWITAGVVAAFFFLRWAGSGGHSSRA